MSLPQGKIRVTDRFRRQDYFDAATERFGQAMDALSSHKHGLALTLAGVAVECLLRAFREPNVPFNSRHDLMVLADEANFLPKRSQKQKESLSAELTALRMVWRNNHRYRSEAKLQTWLKELDLMRFQAAKGDKGALKMAAASALENAKIVMAYGVTKWESAKK